MGIRKDIPVAVSDRKVFLNWWGTVKDGQPRDITINIYNLTTAVIQFAWINREGAQALVDALTEHFDLSPKTPQPAVRPIVFAGPFEVFENLGAAKDRMLELLGDGITSTVVNATVEGEFNTVTGLTSLTDFRYAEPGDLS